MTNLLRIGAFAKLGRVSVKALRFYDQEGLLRPEHVDRRSGYRFYSLQQIETLALITNLRAGGFSIAEIRAIVRASADPATMAKALEAQRERLRRERAELGRRQRVVDALARTAGVRANKDEAVRLVRVGPQLVHAKTRVVRGEGAEIAELFEAAEARVAAFGARAPVSPYLIYHQRDEAALKIEVCIPVTRPAPTGLATLVDSGAAQACSLIYAGAYDKTETLARRLSDWIARAGFRPAGPLREVYHRFGADEKGYRLPASMLAAMSADYLTELQIPVAHS